MGGRSASGVELRGLARGAGGIPGAAFKARVRAAVRETVDADEVRAQMFALGRRARDSLLGMPDRLAPILAGQADAAVIHRLLTEEIERGLAELSTAPPIKAAATG